MTHNNARQIDCKMKVLSEPKIHSSDSTLKIEECHFLANLEFEDGTKLENCKIWFPIGLPNTHIPKLNEEICTTVAKMDDAYSLVQIL